MNVRKVIFLNTSLKKIRSLEKKICSVSTRLSEHFIAIRHLNKLEIASISIRKQNKSNV